MKKSILSVLCFFTLFSIAQNNDTDANFNRFTFKVGANLVDNTGEKNPFNGLDIGKAGFTNQIAGGIDYKFNSHWSLGLFVSNNKFLKSKGVIDEILITEDLKYFATDINAKYSFWSAQHEDEKGFNAYLSGGLGLFKVKENTLSYNVGLGINYWFSKSFGLNLESVAKWTGESDVKYDSNHFQHFVGIMYRPKGENDRDKDGIVDEEDTCPDVFGLLENNGCPDSDNDGIVDSEDGCPEAAGTKANNGCPDSDNDGVIDSRDSCKNTYGPKANNGCPYKDSDKDGILDKDDKCPNVKGIYGNNGCPKEEEEVVVDNTKEMEHTNTMITEYAKSIYFDTSKSSFKNETYVVLNNVVASLKEFPSANIMIEGHTDSVGKEAFNQELSTARANAVRKYLISKGISGENIETRGYGESNPAESNRTRQGREMNRRVHIRIKN